MRGPLESARRDARRARPGRVPQCGALRARAGPAERADRGDGARRRRHGALVRRPHGLRERSAPHPALPARSVHRPRSDGLQRGRREGPRHREPARVTHAASQAPDRPSHPGDVRLRPGDRCEPIDRRLRARCRRRSLRVRRRRPCAGAEGPGARASAQPGHRGALRIHQRSARSRHLAGAVRRRHVSRGSLPGDRGRRLRPVLRRRERRRRGPHADAARHDRRRTGAPLRRRRRRPRDLEPDLSRGGLREHQLHHGPWRQRRRGRRRHPLLDSRRAGSPNGGRGDGAQQGGRRPDVPRLSRCKRRSGRGQEPRSRRGRHSGQRGPMSARGGGCRTDSGALLWLSEARLGRRWRARLPGYVSGQAGRCVVRPCQQRLSRPGSRSRRHPERARQVPGQPRDLQRLRGRRRLSRRRAGQDRGAGRSRSS